MQLILDDFIETVILKTFWTSIYPSCAFIIILFIWFNHCTRSTIDNPILILNIPCMYFLYMLMYFHIHRCRISNMHLKHIINCWFKVFENYIQIMSLSVYLTRLWINEYLKQENCGFSVPIYVPNLYAQVPPSYYIIANNATLYDTYPCSSNGLIKLGRVRILTCSRVPKTPTNKNQIESRGFSMQKLDAKVFLPFLSTFERTYKNRIRKRLKVNLINLMTVMLDLIVVVCL